VLENTSNARRHRGLFRRKPLGNPFELKVT
jgi:hypothetical protein